MNRKAIALLCYILCIGVIVVEAIPVKKVNYPNTFPECISIYCEPTESDIANIYVAYAIKNRFDEYLNEQIPFDATCIIIASGKTPNKDLNSSLLNSFTGTRFNKFTLFGNIRNCYEKNGQWYIEIDVREWSIDAPIQRKPYRFFANDNYLSLFDYSFNGILRSFMSQIFN